MKDYQLEADIHLMEVHRAMADDKSWEDYCEKKEKENFTRSNKLIIDRLMREYNFDSIKFFLFDKEDSDDDELQEFDRAYEAIHKALIPTYGYSISFHIIEDVIAYMICKVIPNDRMIIN